MATAYQSKVGPVQMLDGRRRAWKIMPTVYEVVSRKADRRYQVVVVEPVTMDEFEKVHGRLDCQCPAGLNARPCWHAALVMARILREKVA